jgi:hypothetical protein
MNDLLLTTRKNNMRLRLAFKLHGDEADLARQIADAAGIEVDKVAKLAMQRYMADVIQRATELADKQRGISDGQSSPADPVHAAGTVPPAQDSVSSQASGQS